MQKTIRIWTALGAVMLAAPALADAESSPPEAPVILADNAGEGGEGGGEGGGDTPTTYALDSNDPNAFNFDARPQVLAYSEHVYGSYTQARTGTETLAAAIDALLAQPTAETLAAARKAWVAARPAYLKTEAFRFYDGPIEAIEGEINAWPLNEAYIDYVEGNPGAGLVNSGGDIDSAALTALNQKSDEADVTTGWHAIEFLLWGQDLSAEGPGARPYTDYIAGEADNDRRRAYLEAAARKLADDLRSLEAAWAPGVADNYRARFEKLEQREALGRIVNGMAVLAGFEFMSERLAVALDSGDQEDEHSCFSDTTKQDFVFDLAGIADAWKAAKLGDLLASRNPEAAKALDAAMADAEAKIAALGDPWDRVLAAPKDSPERKTAEAAVQSLQSLADALRIAGNAMGVLVLIPSS